MILMILAAFYEHNDVVGVESDVESSNSGNNNERIGTYSDKNFSDERRISIIQDNSKELIEKSERVEREAKDRRKQETSREKGTSSWFYSFNGSVQTDSRIG